MKITQYSATKKGLIMRKLLIALTLFSIGTSLSIANGEVTETDMLAPIDLSSPEATAYSMMRAMYQGDADMVDQVFAPDAQLRRVSDQGDLRPDGLQRWRDWVGTLSVGDAHETLFDVDTQRFGRLATVWAPFTITVKGDLVGCGVNQFTMADTDGDWHIIFGMDTNAASDTCEDFQAKYSEISK